MATAVPDPRDLKSWEDAFQYPIPAVRGMEKKLRSGLEENHDKLRSLVGGSYRDLLGTARTIVEVNGQTQKVESLLGEASRKCDSRVVERIGNNYAKFDAEIRAQDQDRFALASQISVLQASLDVVSTLLSSAASTLLAAKLLVVSRLLHKTLSQIPSTHGNVVPLGKRLESLRQRLLRRIDKRLSRIDNETTTLMENMTAWSLATSSTPSDVLKHFQYLRLSAIGVRSRTSRQTTKIFVLGRLRLFLSTLKNTQTIFPELLQASLRGLGAKPLLKDQTILDLDELNLDIHERWFSSDIRNYTPWNRHDELDRRAAELICKNWAEEAFSSLKKAISTCIQDEESLDTLTEIRYDVLQTWLSSRRITQQLDFRLVLNELRQIFNERQQDIVQNSFHSLEDSVCKVTIEKLNSWDSVSKSSATNVALWDLFSQSLDISDGAAPFRKQIIDRRTGQTEAIGEILDAYTAPAKRISEIPSTIKRMRDARWEDDYDDGAYDDNDDDDDDQNTIWQLLSRTDPEQLQSSLHETAQQSIQRMERSLTESCRGKFTDCSSANATGPALLRILRELRHRLPRLLNNISRDIVPGPIFTDLLDTLQTSISNYLSQKPHNLLEKQLRLWIRSPKHADALWEGKPPLPIQPSPATFKYLRRIVSDMEGLGPDLWSPDLVDKLKQAISSQAGGKLRAAVDAIEQEDNAIEATVYKTVDAKTSDANESDAEGKSRGETDDTAEQVEPNGVKNGNGGDEGVPTTNHLTNVENARPQTVEKLVQLLFDAHYLEQAFTLSGEAKANTGLDEAVTLLISKAGLDEGSKTRVHKNATEYWKRTYLLFGLLAT